jgi:hypothetical protein
MSNVRPRASDSMRPKIVLNPPLPEVVQFAQLFHQDFGLMRHGVAESATEYFRILSPSGRWLYRSHCRDSFRSTQARASAVSAMRGGGLALSTGATRLIWGLH